MELLAAGALGWWQRKPRIGQQRLQQGRIDAPTGGKCTIGIERRAVMALTPAVQQRIGRAGIESPHRAIARNQGQVADPAQIEHGAVFVACAQHGQMEGGHQGRALATGSHIATSEIGHRGNAGVLGNSAGIADLPGERRARVGPVADGLPMRADRANLATLHAAVADQLIGRRRERQPHLRVQLA